jgi:hypothetical protein
VKVGRDRIPLAGAHAECDVDRFGMAGRNHRATLIVTGADGQKYSASFGGGFGQKGGSSRREAQRAERLAMRINNAAL